MWINENTKTVYKLHSDIRVGFPYVSMPTEISDDTIAFLGLKVVTPIEKPSGKIVEESPPVFDNGIWYQQWSTREPTSNETLEKSAEIRQKRDSLLSDTDWVIAKAYETQSQIPANYISYRQSLRDITIQPGFPWEVTWPTLNN